MTYRTALLAALAFGIVLITAAVPTISSASISVLDDRGNTVTVASPASRVISLAPHATELLFAAGAGSKVVGVSTFSDFPIEAKHLPSVGGSGQLDLERIIRLKPDLIVAWASGNNPRQLARLRKLGFTVFESEPRSFDMVASSMERLGSLVGSDQGKSQAEKFRHDVMTLQRQYAERSTVTVFYQIWAAPLMTLNDTHIVSQAINLCGGINRFGQLKPLVPTISRESVMKANPDMIITSDENQNGLARWQTFKRMKAVVYGNLFYIDGSVMNRAGPRVIDATRTLCNQIDQARHKIKHHAEK